MLHVAKLDGETLSVGTLDDNWRFTGPTVWLQVNETVLIRSVESLETSPTEVIGFPTGSFQVTWDGCEEAWRTVNV